MRQSPPKLARSLLRLFLRRELAEEVQGDLEEKFYKSLSVNSALSSKANYWFQVLNYVRPFAIRKLSVNNINPYDMYSNYFKTSLRAFKRGKLHSAINVLGLTTGMAVTMLLGLWLWDEITFNNYHTKHGRVAQVIQNVTNNGEVQTWTNVPFPLAEEIRQNYGADFVSVVMGTGIWKHSIVRGDEKFYKSGAFFEPKAPELFSLRMVKGNAEALRDPSAILLSESAAKSLFGNAVSIGQALTIDENKEVMVMGVYEDLPSNSDFADMEFIAPFELYYTHSGWMQSIDDPWRPNAFNLFVQLRDDVAFADASMKIKDAKLRKLSEDLAKKKPELFLHPMDQWHLYSEFENGVNVGGRIRYVWLFGIISVFVLGMACINFMNLSTARSERRSKEIGVRKALGSFRTQLIQQFFTESMLMSMFSFLLALALVYLTLPYFNEMSSKELKLFWTEPWFWLICFGFVLVTGVLAGSYPALYLSAIKSIGSLKGSLKSHGTALAPRRVMVVLQFVVSISLISGTIVVYRQIEYARNRPVGYDREGLISVSINNDDVYSHLDVIQEELIKENLISMAGMTQAPLDEEASSTSVLDWQGKSPDLSVDFLFTGINADYGTVINWEMMQGRDFSHEFLSDSSAMVINESAAEFMGLKNPVGSTIYWYDQPYNIIGVVNDIIVGSPYDNVKPHLYYLANSFDYFLVRIRPELGTRAALGGIESVFRKYNPGEIFSFSFVNDDYARKFGSEERVGILAGMFSGLAIFISLLGIFGLASFEAEQRTKEIGIRKVVGASVFALWVLLTKDFVVLVIISFIIAVPIGYIGLSNWLQNFLYHTQVGWWTFLASLIGVLGVTIFVVSFQAIKAARMNPVNTLRSE